MRTLRPHVATRWRAPRDRRHSPPSFTLLELLAVAAVIILLAGLVVGIANYARVKTYTNKARAEIAVLETAIESFKIDAGRYPTSTVYRGTIWGYDYLGLFWEMANSSLLGHQLVGGGYVDSSGLLIRSNGVQTAFPYCDPSWNNGFKLQTNLLHVILDPWERPYNYYRTYPLITSGYATSGSAVCTYPYSPYPYDSTNPAYVVTNTWSAWVGGQINATTYDLWSYGIDRKSSGPGWNVGWKAQFDDIANFTVP